MMDRVADFAVQVFVGKLPNRLEDLPAMEAVNCANQKRIIGITRSRSKDPS
jgi:hypothetical protein